MDQKVVLAGSGVLTALAGLAGAGAVALVGTATGTDLSPQAVMSRETRINEGMRVMEIMMNAAGTDSPS